MTVTLAGQTLVAGRIPEERLAKTEVIADSSTTTTTELTVITVVAPLVSGGIYRVTAYGHVNSSVGTDTVTTRIREDSSVGNELQQDGGIAIAGSTTSGRKFYMQVEYTAVATGNKTFVVTVNRSSGTGNVNLEASGARPAYAYVDYIRGL
jgi:hypothetical protein